MPTQAPAAAEAARASPGASRLVAAFGAVYVIWGSTYLAIRFAIETLPPLAMASTRFLVAGCILFAWARSRGARPPTASEWRAATIAGALMLGAGTGAVAVAEQWVPSGIVAVLVASVPFWMVVFDAVFVSRVAPSRRVLGGLAVGFAGVGLLGNAPGGGLSEPGALLGATLVLVGSASWAGGSIYLRGAPVPPSPLMGVAIQSLAGGGVLAVVAAVTGQWAGLTASEVSFKSAAALAYLVVFGSLIAYSAYVWLIKVQPPARVGTYAYVNPVIALFLGWALADEPVTAGSLLAAAIVVGAVMVIVSEGRGRGLRGALAAGRRA